MNVYAYRSGKLVFTSKGQPTGTLTVLENATREQVKTIKVRARMAYDGKTYLVPGLPEAGSASEALEKFIKWLCWIDLDGERTKVREEI